MIPAVVYVVTLFPLTFDAGGHGSPYDWIPLDRSRDFITAPALGCLHAPLLPSWSISSAFGYHPVCSLPHPSMLAKSHFLMLTA